MGFERVSHHLLTRLVVVRPCVESRCCSDKVPDHHSRVEQGESLDSYVLIDVAVPVQRAFATKRVAHAYPPELSESPGASSLHARLGNETHQIDIRARNRVTVYAPSSATFPVYYWCVGYL